MPAVLRKRSTTVNTVRQLRVAIVCLLQVMGLGRLRLAVAAQAASAAGQKFALQLNLVQRAAQRLVVALSQMPIRIHSLVL